VYLEEKLAGAQDKSSISVTNTSGKLAKGTSIAGMRIGTKQHLTRASVACNCKEKDASKTKDNANAASVLQRLGGGQLRKMDVLVGKVLTFLCEGNVADTLIVRVSLKLTTVRDIIKVSV